MKHLHTVFGGFEQRETLFSCPKTPTAPKALKNSQKFANRAEFLPSPPPPLMLNGFALQKIVRVNNKSKDPQKYEFFREKNRNENEGAENMQI